MHGYRIFRKNIPRSQGGRVVLDVREQQQLRLEWMMSKLSVHGSKLANRPT